MGNIHSTVAEATRNQKKTTAGIAKINVETEIRQAYEKSMEETSGSIIAAQERVYLRVREINRGYSWSNGSPFPGGEPRSCMTPPVGSG